MLGLKLIHISKGAPDVQVIDCENERKINLYINRVRP